MLTKRKLAVDVSDAAACKDALGPLLTTGIGKLEKISGLLVDLSELSPGGLGGWHLHNLVSRG